MDENTFELKTAENIYSELAKSRACYERGEFEEFDDALDEISKILFMKIREERKNQGTKVFTKAEYTNGKKLYEENIRPNLSGDDKNLEYMQFLFRSTKEEFKDDRLFEQNEVIKIRENSFEQILEKLENIKKENNTDAYPSLLRVLNQKTINENAIFWDKFKCKIDAYDEETLENGEVRKVMHLQPFIAPFKASILPLSKQLAPKAKEIFDSLIPYMNVSFDVTGSIGKRYRRNDEIGTPYCVTIDFDTENDNSVTVRDRDSMKQERIEISKLKDYLMERTFCK